MKIEEVIVYCLATSNRGMRSEQIAEIEAKINEEISKSHDVTIEFMNRDQAAATVDLSKLPEDASETLRIVRIGIMMLVPASEPMSRILMR